MRCGCITEFSRYYVWTVKMRNEEVFRRINRDREVFKVVKKRKNIAGNREAMDSVTANIHSWVCVERRRLIDINELSAQSNMIQKLFF